MSKIFNSIPRPKGKRSRFNLSHSYKTAGGIGRLIPVLCREVLPGDIWNVNTSTLVRLAPTLAPVMHNINIRTECFFVPNRLIWKDWQDFITGGNDGTLAPIKPYLPASYFASLPAMTVSNSNYDYLGMPVRADGTAALANDSTRRIDIMPLLALQLVYNEYYRDPNLDPDFSSFFPVNSGNYLDRPTGAPSPTELLGTKSRCWEKDYFTAALPWTQRGPQAQLPATINTTYSGTVPNPTPVQMATTSSGEGKLQAVATPNPVDLEQVASVTINDLRRTSAVQRWLENNARGGSRYIEQILAHFGVISSDSRLQRPEFLGAGKSPVIISEVLQTSGTGTTGQATPQANMAGHGIGGGINHGC